MTDDSHNPLCRYLRSPDDTTIWRYAVMERQYSDAAWDRYLAQYQVVTKIHAAKAHGTWNGYVSRFFEKAAMGDIPFSAFLSVEGRARLLRLSSELIVKGRCG